MSDMDESVAIVDRLLNEAAVHAEKCEWAFVDRLCEQILNENPNNPSAFLFRLMSEYKVSKVESLESVETPFDNNTNYQSILRFGNEKLVNTLKDYNITIKDRVYASAYSEYQRFDRSDLIIAKEKFISISGWKDADELAIACQRKIEESIEEEAITKSTVIPRKMLSFAALSSLFIGAFLILFFSVMIPNSKYNKAVELMNTENYEEALWTLLRLNYKDSDELAREAFRQCTTIRWVDLGRSATCAYTLSREVYVWGSVALGNDAFSQESTPLSIFPYFDLRPGEYIKSISTGDRLFVALTSEGRIFNWGSSRSGLIRYYYQIGHSPSYYVLTPMDVTPFFDLSPGESIVFITSESEYSFALTSNGRVLIWGGVSRYYFDGSSEKWDLLEFEVPTDITARYDLGPGESIVSAFLGHDHQAVLTSNGRVLMYGRNNRGQLGDGTEIDHYGYPAIDITAQFDLMPGETVSSLSLADDHSAAITSEGRVFVWGRNRDGQIGDGTYDDSASPIDITSFFDLDQEDKIASISLGQHCSSAVSLSGRVFTWGTSSSGILGDGTVSRRYTPIDISSSFDLRPGEIVMSVSMETHSAVAVTSFGRVFTWGDNYYGQLGDGTDVDKYTPMYVFSIFDVDI